MYRLCHTDCVDTTDQAPLKNEDGDGHQDADTAINVGLQKEEQRLVSTEQLSLKATDGKVVECNATAVVNEWETEESKVKSSKERTPPYMSPSYIDSDQEVRQ